ncbi:hypothetical protein BJF78_26875 [Pseudonocardia sp. CNS-139]|nr:hypothetical protein BJF78_26875 [Pseudonocardia sp. CNS-139]
MVLDDRGKPVGRRQQRRRCGRAFLVVLGVVVLWGPRPVELVRLDASGVGLVCGQRMTPARIASATI